MTKVGSQTPLPGAMPAVGPRQILAPAPSGQAQGQPQQMQAVRRPVKEIEKSLKKEKGISQVEQISAGTLAEPIETGDIRVKVYNDMGQIIELMPRDYAELASLSGEAQFKLAQKLGIIGEQAQYVPGEQGSWSYIPGPQKEKGRLAEIRAREAEQRERALVTLADGNKISGRQFRELPEAVQEIGLTQGLEAMNQALKLISEFQSAVNTLAVQGGDSKNVLRIYGGLSFKSLEDAIERGDIDTITKALENTKEPQWIELSALLKSLSKASATSLIKGILQSGRDYAQVVAQEKAFKEQNIELGSGQWVSKVWFESLPEDLQQVGLTQGYDALVEALDKYIEQFKTQNVEIAGGDWIPKEIWESLSPELQQIGMAEGYDALMTEFASQNLLLPDGTWVSREEWNKLPSEMQELGITQGYDALLQELNRQQAEFDQWLKTLPLAYQLVYKEQGNDALQKTIDDAFKKIEPYQVKNPDGTLAYNLQAAVADMVSGKLDRSALELAFGAEEIANAEKLYLALTPEARAGGIPAFDPNDPANFEAMLQWWQQARTAPISQEEFLRLTIDPVAQVVTENIQKDIQAGKYQEFLPQFIGNQAAALDWWVKAVKGEIPLSSKEAEQVRQLVQAKLGEVISQMTPFVLTGPMHDEVDIVGMMKAGIEPQLIYAYAGGQEGTGMTIDEFRAQAEWERDWSQASTLEKANIMTEQFIKESPVLAAEMIVPGLYVARHWDELAPWERAVSIGIDALSLIPIVGGAAAGARSVATASRTARAIQAGKGALKGAGTLVTAPINMIIHPLETAKWTKTTVRSLLENLLDPKKIPEAVISTTTGVPMIRVGTDMSVDEALKAQEELLKSIQQGGRPLIYVKNSTTGSWDMVELVRGPLMDITGGVVHASPDISKIAKGTKVLPKGVIPEEEGIFVGLQPSIEFALKKPPLPVPQGASPAMKTLAQQYRELELFAQADLPPIRSLKFADATQITEEFEQKVLRPYLEGLRIRQPDFRIGGSFNEWLKVPGAKRPNDIDIITRNAHEELNKLIEMAQAAGFNARRAPGLNSLIISKGSKTWRPVDMPPMELHVKQIPAELTKPIKYIDGFPFENIGEQYIRQSFGAISGTKKAPQRLSRLKKMAPKILKELERQGIHIAEPGIAIYSPETARKAVASQKTFFSHKGMELSLEKPKLTAEMEGKFLVDEVLPQLQYSLYTRIGPEGTKLTIYLEKPLTRRQIAKLKALGLVETLKAPFKPPLKIAHGATPLALSSGLGSDDIDELADFLRQTGNDDVARRLKDLNELYVRPNIAAMYRALNTTVGRATRSAPPILQPETGRLVRPDSLNRNATIRAIARATVALPATRVERRQARARAGAEVVRPLRETEVTRLPREIEAVRPPREIEPIRPPKRPSRIRDIKPPPPKPPPGRIPPPVPPPSPPEKRDRYAKKTTRQEQRYDGAVAWQQGALKRDDKLVPVWKVWSAPYNQRNLETFFENELPPGVKTVGGIKEAAETVQLYRGKASPSESHRADIGAFTVTIKSVSPEPGVAAEMEFRPDRPSDKTLKKMPLGTTVNQLIREVYPAKVPKSTADRMLREKLSKMPAKEIASELNKALGQEKTRSKRLDEVLSMLPDRVAQEVEMWMGTTSEEAPVRGYPKPEMIPEKFRRKKRTLKTGAKKAKIKSKSEPDSERGVSLVRGVV